MLGLTLFAASGAPGCSDSVGESPIVSFRPLHYCPRLPLHGTLCLTAKHRPRKAREHRQRPAAGGCGEVQRPELQNPSPPCSVGDTQTALREQIFDVAIGERNSGPLHHDRRISTARSSAPIVPIGRNSGTQSIHGLQTSRRSWPSGSITGTGIGPIRRWAAFHPSTGSANESTRRPSRKRRGCIRPHTRAHQDRRLSPRQSSR